MVWLATRQRVGGPGGRAGITRNTQGAAITPIMFRAQQYSCPNCQMDFIVMSKLMLKIFFDNLSI